MVFHALPRMQRALVGAERLECGSLLPLCVYAQTSCLEPDRNDAENNVSVPISASDWFLRRLRLPPIGARDNSPAMPRSGGKTQTSSLSLYLGPCSMCVGGRQPSVSSKNRDSLVCGAGCQEPEISPESGPKALHSEVRRTARPRNEFEH